MDRIRLGVGGWVVGVDVERRDVVVSSRREQACASLLHSPAPGATRGGRRQGKRRQKAGKGKRETGEGELGGRCEADGVRWGGT